ncbi:hypothetical protein GWI34_39800, partial [Actinomadura sp. DSM 109109]|nr:hypothetical protein [Actinomadura lepetitiana]
PAAPPAPERPDVTQRDIPIHPPGPEPSPEVTRQDLRPGPPAAPRKEAPARSRDPRPLERPKEPHGRPPVSPHGAAGPRPDVTQQDIRPRPPARPGAPGQGVPPRRLDAPRREPQGEDQGKPGGRGSLPPRRLDALRWDDPSREPGAQAGPTPAQPPGRSDIPSIWGKPG